PFMQATRQPVTPELGVADPQRKRWGRGPAQPLCRRSETPPMPLLSLFEPTVILPFLVAVALVELTPGPNMGWLALIAAGRGRTAALAAVAGVTLGLAVWMLAAVVGVAALVI